MNEWYKMRQYDVISCLNVLDRCERPYQLLQQIHQALKPEGLAVIAVVLPYEPYVELGNAESCMRSLPFTFMSYKPATLC